MDAAAGDEDGGGGVRGSGGYDLPRRGTKGESEGGVGFALELTTGCRFCSVKPEVWPISRT